MTNIESMVNDGDAIEIGGYNEKKHDNFPCIRIADACARCEERKTNA